MRLLDLYCGNGLGAWGYWRSGRFSEIVGVDSDCEKLAGYSFDKMPGNVLELTYDFLLQFDFIHASPPCQAYSKITPDRSKHMRLIAATHLICQATGVPYVIENVEGSSRELKPNCVLSGQPFGLDMCRRRYFHVSLLDKPIRRISSAAATHVHGGSITKAGLIAAFGLETLVPGHALSKMTVSGIEQGIPPVMTKFIAETVLPDKFMIG